MSEMKMLILRGIGGRDRREQSTNSNGLGEFHGDPTVTSLYGFSGGASAQVRKKKAKANQKLK